MFPLQFVFLGGACNAYFADGLSYQSVQSSHGVPLVGVPLLGSLSLAYISLACLS